MELRITLENAIQSVDEQIKWCKDLLTSKNKEYVPGKEPNFCNNFVKAGGLLGESQEMALRGMWAKHLVSICDLIKSMDDGEVVSYALWKEKITDAINYLFILKMMLDAREGKFLKEENVGQV